MVFLLCRARLDIENYIVRYSWSQLIHPEAASTGKCPPFRRPDSSDLAATRNFGAVRGAWARKWGCAVFGMTGPGGLLHGAGGSGGVGDGATGADAQHLALIRFEDLEAEACQLEDFAGARDVSRDAIQEAGDGGCV